MKVNSGMTHPETPLPAPLIMLLLSFNEHVAQEETWFLNAHTCWERTTLSSPHIQSAHSTPCIHLTTSWPLVLKYVQPKPFGEADLRPGLSLSLRLDASPINAFLVHSLSGELAFLHAGHVNLGSVTWQRQNMEKHLWCNTKWTEYTYNVYRRAYHI